MCDNFAMRRTADLFGGRGMRAHHHGRRMPRVAIFDGFT